jgi:tRNA pseudouridine55 synthase
MIVDEHAEDRATAAAARRRPGRNVDGILLLDKPFGMSSNRAVQCVKRLLAARKAGHTGSLDPLATGMLPICLGQATKMAAFLLDSAKTYRVEVCFGTQTTTGDAEGSVLRTGPESVPHIELQRLLESFRGTLLQTPPMYSALKRNGRRLYELARAGLEISREPRIIHVYDLRLEVFDVHRPVLRVHCGKGTYIRSLVEDIACAAGTVAHVSALRRLAVEPFSERAMRTFEDLEAAAAGGHESIDRFLTVADEAVRSLPALQLSQIEVLRIRHGQQVSRNAEEAGMVRLYDQAGRFIGIGEGLPGRSVRARRLMTGTATEDAVTESGPRLQYRAF